jgi:hypothetical protein
MISELSEAHSSDEIKHVKECLKIALIECFVSM